MNGTNSISESGFEGQEVIEKNHSKQEEVIQSSEAVDWVPIPGFEGKGRRSSISLYGGFAHNIKPYRENGPLF